jgi:hypothetical protein
MATLVHFGVINQDDKSNYTLLPKETVSDEQIRDLLLLYGANFLKSEVVDLQSFPEDLLYYFKPVNMVSVAQRFNGKDWEYVREVERNLLMIKNRKSG